MGRPKKGERVTGPYRVEERFRLTFTVADGDGGYRKIQKTFDTEQDALDAKAGFEEAQAQSEVQALSIKAQTGREPGVVGYWRLDGKTATDYGPKGLHGTLVRTFLADDQRAAVRGSDHHGDRGDDRVRTALTPDLGESPASPKP